jgi:hypothetical protein
MFTLGELGFEVVPDLLYRLKGAAAGNPSKSSRDGLFQPRRRESFETCACEE